jgi:hypothetical protein
MKKMLPGVLLTVVAVGTWYQLRNLMKRSNTQVNRLN